MDKIDGYRYTALHQSLLNAPVFDTAELLIELGADINLRTVYGNTVAMSIVMAQDERALKWALEHGANIDEKSKGMGNFTPRSMATRTGLGAVITTHERKQTKTKMKEEGLV